jgi:hypothetical protein
VYVAAYDAIAPDGEMLSEFCDRTLESHPWLTRTVVAVTALHLLNLLDERVDPFAYVVKGARWRLGSNIQEGLC